MLALAAGVSWIRVRRLQQSSVIAMRARVGGLATVMRRVSVVKQQDESGGGGGALSLLLLAGTGWCWREDATPRNMDLDQSSPPVAGKEDVWLVGRGSGAHLLTVR